MKNTFYTILIYGFIIGFLLYWTAIVVIAMPPNRAKEFINKKAPRFKNYFGTSWKLFTPTYTFNYSLYFITSDTNDRNKPDTTEVLAHIAQQKQARAPFNQREDIIDHFVTNTVIRLMQITWINKKMPAEDSLATLDSAYVARTVANAAINKKYAFYIGTLMNYFRLLSREKNIDIAGKRIKILIKEKMIPPFKEMNNPRFFKKEILIFETPYIPAAP